VVELVAAVAVGVVVIVDAIVVAEVAAGVTE